MPITLAFANGCSAPRRAGDGSLDGAAHPTLEEIFLIPGVQGRPPQVERLSANGAWMTLRWNPVETKDNGERDISSRGALRVLSTRDPEASAFHGRPLIELLPPPPPKPPPPPETSGEKPARSGADEGALIARWSRSGARLAVARGRRIYVLDPPSETRGTWRTNLFYEAPEGEGEKLGDIDSLEFERDDSALRVVAEKELWILPLAADDGHAWPIQADSARCLTREIEAPASALQWSDDLRVALGAKPPAAWMTPPPPDPAAESKPPEKQPAHVVEIESGRRVELEGVAGMRWIESASLSPDGRFVFAEDPDKSAEPAPTLVPDYLTARVTTREARRELADDLPSPCRLWMWDVDSGVRSSVELDGDGVAWLREIGWAPRPDKTGPARYAFSRLSHDFRTLEYWCWTEGELRLCLTDRDERWIGGPTEGARWSRDGRWIIFGSESLADSDSRGRNQLFRLDPECGTATQLTHVSGEVSSFSLQDDGGVVFTYSEAQHPERRRIGWVTPGGEMRALASPEGYVSNLSPSARAGWVAFRLERLGQPGEVWITPQLDSSAPRQLTRTTPDSYARIDWIRPELFSVEGEHGARVKSHVFLPRDSSLAHPDRPRAAIVFIHGAGYLQNVTDSMTEYEVNLMFHSRLAEMGYVVVDVDYRGSEGYGHDFRTDVQGWLGRLELDDIHRTLDALAARGVIDAKRVGCYGGSYGGFLTLMALFTASDRWACGAALRSVTDWRTYHPAYTQPRLGRPSTDAEAYARSSPIDHVEGLEHPLLILHGMVDTNVFAQDSIRLIEKLIDLGKNFDAMLYPSQGHGFQDGRHWVDEYRRIERFLTEHLGAP